MAIGVLVDKLRLQLYFTLTNALPTTVSTSWAVEMLAQFQVSWICAFGTATSYDTELVTGKGHFHSFTYLINRIRPQKSYHFGKEAIVPAVVFTFWIIPLESNIVFLAASRVWALSISSWQCFPFQTYFPIYNYTGPLTHLDNQFPLSQPSMLTTIYMLF